MHYRWTGVWLTGALYVRPSEHSDPSPSSCVYNQLPQVVSLTQPLMLTVCDSYMLHTGRQHPVAAGRRVPTAAWTVEGSPGHGVWQRSHGMAAWQTSGLAAYVA